MNKRLNSLKKELGVNTPDFQDDTKSIISRVNDTIYADPGERKFFMRPRLVKIMVAAVLIATLGATTVLAAMNTNFLANFFTGDTSPLAEYVQTPNQSVTDGNYTLTLEQVLMTTHQAFVLYSVEALTDEAIAELNATNEHGFSTFIGMDTISFGPVDWQSAWLSGLSQRELLERRTDTKRYFTLSADILNENEEDFFIRLNVMNDPEKIIIPMATNVETRKLVLGDQAVVQITPLGISIDRVNNNLHGEFTLDAIAGISFRMRDGVVKTFSQVTQTQGGRAIQTTEDGNLKTTVLFREIMMLDRFESIILDDTEFNFANPAITTPFVADETLQPFELTPYFREAMRVPLKELCENIGAKFVWNAETNSATVTFRNSTFVIEVGSTAILKNGQTIDFFDEHHDEAAFVAGDGRLMVSVRLLDLMGIDVVVTNQWDSSRNLLPVEVWRWIILP